LQRATGALALAQDADAVMLLRQIDDVEVDAESPDDRQQIAVRLPFHPFTQGRLARRIGLRGRADHDRLAPQVLDRAEELVASLLA